MEGGLCRGFRWPPGAEHSSMPFQGVCLQASSYLSCGLRPRVELRLLSGPWYNLMTLGSLSFRFPYLKEPDISQHAAL